MTRQTDLIRAHLEAGGEITPLEALDRFGCLRLAARIRDLRRDGLEIESMTGEANGKRFARYRLVIGRREAAA